jgi:hypothetical protein
MNVYVENILKNAASISVTNAAPYYTADMLYDEALSNSVVFTQQYAAIEVKWGLNQLADTVAVLGSNFNLARLSVYRSDGTDLFYKDIVSSGEHTIIKLPEERMMTNLTFRVLSTLKGQNLEMGILFVGRRIELPLFDIGFKYKLNVNSKAERTRWGIAYGSKKPCLRSFDVAFTGIDNQRRSVMEEYIDAVQYVRPHLVEPYESPEFPPVYATLADAGGFDSKDDTMFRWNSALSYMEAK